MICGRPGAVIAEVLLPLELHEPKFEYKNQQLFIRQLFILYRCSAFTIDCNEVAASGVRTGANGGPGGGGDGEKLEGLRGSVWWNGIQILIL